MKHTQRRLRLWHWLVGGLAVLVLTPAIAIPIWMRSTGDIEAFQARAKARGIPTTWAEVASERPWNPGRIAIFEELLQMVDKVQAWEEVSSDHRSR